MKTTLSPKGASSDKLLTAVNPLLMSPQAVQTQYIVTLTLYEHLQSFKRVGLRIPERGFVQEIENGILARIKNGFRGSSVKVVSLSFTEHCDRIVSKMRQAREEYPDAVVVSTTPLITHDTNGLCFQITRLINNHGEFIGMGARSGQHTVPCQVEAMRDRIANHQVIIIDDGAFTGGTLAYLMDILAKYNARVVAIVLGVLFPKALKRIHTLFKKEIICADKFEHPLDWMPMHDFVPFMPNSGKVVGTFLGGDAVPLYLPNGGTLSVPYILPYGLPNKWGGLAFSEYDLQYFSQHCLTASMFIFQEMERLNKRPIKIGDVTRTSPVTPIPISIGQEELDKYDMENRIVDVLNRDCERLG